MTATIPTETIADDLFVGRTGDGARVYVTISIRERSWRLAQSVDHQPIEGYRELSIMGSLIEKGRREPSAVGQIVGYLRDAAVHATGQRAAMLHRLVDIWERWHLNGTRPGCAHQARVGKTAREALDQTPPCPVTGYTWGSAWLVEPLPAEVEAEVRRIVAELS